MGILGNFFLRKTSSSGEKENLSSSLSNINTGLDETKKAISTIEKQITSLTSVIEVEKLDRAAGAIVGFGGEYAEFPDASGVVSRTGMQLTYNQLWEIYKQSSAVRPCVSGLVRYISNLPFKIEPKPDCMNSFDNQHIKDAEEFFYDPNSNYEPFPAILAKCLTDLLVFDVGALEKVRSLNGKTLVELYSRDASEIRPEVDEETLTIIEGYKQIRYGGAIAAFNPEDIVFMVLHPNNKSAYGLPIIESIVDEIAALLFSNSHIANSFDKDEIPPGILDLGDVALEAFERVKQIFESRRGEKKDFKLFATYGGTRGPAWVRLDRDSKELQLDELRCSIERIIFRNFGLTPLELGISESSNRSTALVEERMSQSRLIQPICNLLAYHINKDILSEFGFNDVQFSFKIASEKTNDAAAVQERLIKNGLRTINELRAEEGLAPISGGEKAIIVLPNEVKFLEDIKSIKTNPETPPSNEAGAEQSSNALSESSNKIPESVKGLLENTIANIGFKKE